MPDNTIEWGQGAVNNTNDWGKAKANSTNNFGAVYDDSPSGDTNIAGGTGVALSISYSASAFCEDASDPTPTVTGNVGAGTFSSTTGLVFVSTTTGEVDIDASTSGATYVITYTDTNAATATFNLTINDLDDATFAYSDSSYSQADADPTPTITGLAGGTFSAGSGLVFVDSGSNTGSSTGEIDLSASTIASYTITYTTAGTCPNTSTQTVGVVAALAQVNNVYSMEFDGINDYIDISVANSSGVPSGSSSWTFSGWLYLDSAHTNTANCIFERGEIYPNNGLLVRENAGVIQVFNGSIFEQFTLNFTTNAWNYFALSFNTSTNVLSCYLNDSSQSNTISSGLSIAGNIFYLGKRQDTTSSLWMGKMDEVAVFNTALTAQEVQSIYLATETGKTADLDDLTTPPVKWYRMGD